MKLNKTFIGIFILTTVILVAYTTIQMPASRGSSQVSSIPSVIIEETAKLNAERGLELTPYQYYITQKEGTESPFENEYWNNKEPGIYVDVISGEPLFSSVDKYDSGTGWPSFTKPLNENGIIKSVDNKLIVPRTRIESKDGTNLGHVFDDGPVETGGERFCVKGRR